MAWYLNRALTNFRAAVDARWPDRDRASDGTIGDEAHQARVSDHNPDPDGSVDAWDMDVDGVDVELCKRAFEAHESSGYWVHNDQISFRSESWKPRSYAYAGADRNRHTRHVHWNTRPSHENSAAPWAFPTSAVYPTRKEADMLHGQIPTGPEPIIVCTPWDRSQISFGCDLGSGRARLRVAEHVVNQGWHVSMVDIGSEDATRVDLPGRVNVDRRCILRVPIDAGDAMVTAVGYLAWW